MPDDIRVSLSFRHHRKRKRLAHRLGAEGVLALIDLWCTVAEQCPDGLMENRSPEDIEIDAGWNGEPGKFFDTIIELGFLDKTEEGYFLHNWDSRQEWVSNFEKRSNSGRFSRMAMTHKVIHKELHALGIRSVSKTEYGCLVNPERSVKQSLKIFKQSLTATAKKLTPAPAPAPAPSPVPSPSPSPTTLKDPKPGPKKFTPKKKTTSGSRSGTFKPKKTTKKDQFKFEDLPGIFKDIQKQCHEIISLTLSNPKNKSFNPKLWVQAQLKTKKHPGAILKTLDGLVIYWDTTRDCWSYCDNNLGKFNGNFNEQDAINIHNKIKDKSIPELADLTAGLFEGMGK